VEAVFMADERKCPHCGKPVPATALGGICPDCMLEAGLATQTGDGPTGPPGTRAMPPPPPRPEEIAPLFPQLEILASLGRGGMGAVYRARQPRLDRLVALKILARDKERDPRFAERFTREARALARLNHPNIVTVYDFGEAAGHFYLLMEYVDGLSLRQLLQAGRMPPQQALAIVPKICEALQFAHEHGIVHRDIKPENILLDKTGRVKIADFGIAKMVGGAGEAGSPLPAATTPSESGAHGVARPTHLTEVGHLVGTPHYMAPEQVEHPAAVDHRADIYSLGVVFYEMLTGELPLGKFAPPSRKVQVDVRLDEVVLRALEKEPELRYQQASQVKADVETIAAGGEEFKVRGSKFKEEPLADGTRSGTGSPVVGERGAEQAARATEGPVGKSEGGRQAGSVAGPAGAGPRGYSRTAAAGAIWIGLFFLNAAVGYTPPGWALINFLRNSPLKFASELLLVLPLTVLGFAAVAGSPIVGVVALRQIRRSRGNLRGWRLALFDVLFFPLLLANGWAGWLAVQVVSQIGVAGQAHDQPPLLSALAVAAFGLAALVVNGLLILRAARAARRFVGSPAPPARPRASGSWPQVFAAAARRLLLVLVLQLALFETLQQLSVRWKESTGELWGMALAVASLGGLIWAGWPGYRLKRSWGFWLGGTAGSAALLLALDYFHAFHLRPNLGLHAEAEWVSQHPGFEWGSRQGIAGNLWRQPKAKPFAPPVELFLPLDAAHPVALCDLDTGRQLGLDAFDVENPEATGRARKEMLDLAFVIKPGRVTVLGLDLGVGWVPHFIPNEQLTSQAAVNFWVLDRRQPKAITSLQVATNLVGQFVYRTREGGVGLCELRGLSDRPAGVTVRLQRVPEMLLLPRRPAPEPPWRIIGTVTDATTGRPIAGARVDDNRYGAGPTRAPLQTWTDTNGRYELRTWYEEHTIAASAPGYETRLATLLTKLFGSEREKRIDFQLQPAAGAPQTSLPTPRSVPSVVIETVPPSGAAGVDPALTELRATFSKPMQDGSWSWCRWADGNEENFPQLTGSAHYLEDGRTCVLPVRLEPGRTYALWLNREDSERGFKDASGQSAVAYLLIFETLK
jgi:hypothetical protein